jgi:hypothetical protein
LIFEPKEKAITMANLYSPEIAALDQIYQKEPTVRNELNLEKAKLALYRQQLEQKPGDKELESRVRLHEAEVVRLEDELKIA